MNISRIVTLCISDETLNITNETDAVKHSRVIGIWADEKNEVDLLMQAVDTLAREMKEQIALYFDNCKEI